MDRSDERRERDHAYYLWLAMGRLRKAIQDPWRTGTLIGPAQARAVLRELDRAVGPVDREPALKADAISPEAE